MQGMKETSFFFSYSSPPHILIFLAQAMQVISSSFMYWLYFAFATEFLCLLFIIILSGSTTLRL